MAKNLFIEYPKCSTCQKAKRWLDENKVKYEDRHIVEQTPTKDELKEWIKISKIDIKKFFNTSGMKYKELNLREKLPQMSDEEKLELLSSNGMLIKRPIFVSSKTILLGFKQKEWEDNLLK